MSITAGRNSRRALITVVTKWSNCRQCKAPCVGLGEGLARTCSNIRRLTESTLASHSSSECHEEVFNPGLSFLAAVEESVSEIKNVWHVTDERT
jgi:hypothetical protein